MTEYISKNVGRSINAALLVVVFISFLSARYPAWASGLFILAGAVSVGTVGIMALVQRKIAVVEPAGVETISAEEDPNSEQRATAAISEADLLEVVKASLPEKSQPAAFDKILEQINRNYVVADKHDPRNGEEFSFTLNIINVYISGKNNPGYLGEDKKVDCVLVPELTQSMYNDQPHLH